MEQTSNPDRARMMSVIEDPRMEFLLRITTPGEFAWVLERAQILVSNGPRETALVHLSCECNYIPILPFLVWQYPGECSVSSSMHCSIPSYNVGCIGTLLFSLVDAYPDLICGKLCHSMAAYVKHILHVLGAIAREPLNRSAFIRGEYMTYLHLQWIAKHLEARIPALLTPILNVESPDRGYLGGVQLATIEVFAALVSGFVGSAEEHNSIFQSSIYGTCLDILAQYRKYQGRPAIFVAHWVLSTSKGLGLICDSPRLMHGTIEVMVAILGGPCGRVTEAEYQGLLSCLMRSVHTREGPYGLTDMFQIKREPIGNQSHAVSLPHARHLLY